MCAEASLTSYQARCIAKAYNNAKAPQKAIEAIDKVSSEEVNHWLLYVQTKSYLDFGDYEWALICASRCFELAKADPKTETRMSIYHDQLSKCHEALNNLDEAIEQANQAVDNCEDDKYKKELQNRLSALEQLEIETTK